MEKHTDLIPVIKLSGTHYQLGCELGQLQKDYITSRLNDTEDSYHKLMKPYYDSREGRHVCEQFLSNSEKYYSEYVDEIKGMAKSAGIDTITLFLLFIESEIHCLCNAEFPHFGGEGCTTVLLKNGDTNTALFFHNEDVPPQDVDLGWLVDATISSDEKHKRPEHYVCLHNGSLAGHTFAFNAHGLMTSLNIIFPKPINMEGVPRKIIERATLSAKNIEEVIKVGNRGCGVASGDSINVAQLVRDQPEIVNIERSSSLQGTVYNTRYLEQNDFVYAINEYQRSKVEFFPDLSSQHRIARIKEMLTENGSTYPNSKSDLLSILGDTKTPVYPVYRHGAPPDILATSYTGCFDVNKGELMVLRGNPTSPVASTTLKLADYTL